MQEHAWEIPGRILLLRTNWWWLLCGGLVAEPWTLMEGCFGRWVQRKEAFWKHPGARITSSSCFLPSQGSCRGVREKNLVTRCRQEKYMEEESVCFSSMFWLGHYQMKLIFCPFFPDLSLSVFTLFGNHSSELLHLLLLHILWDAIFQNIPAMHANQSVPWMLKSTSS